jgi:hydrogenase maturation factor
VLGVRPRWFLAVFLLPVGTTESDVAGIFENMREMMEALDILLVGGHTEVTAAVNQPVVTGQMLGFQEDGSFVKTGGVQAGDTVLQVGPAPIEGAAVVALELGDSLDVSRELLAAARAAIHDPGISVVEPALRAAGLGACAMHDPTEGGMSAGLHELAEASDVMLRVDGEAALWFAPGIALCDAIGADPWGMLASGTLLAAFPAATVDAAVTALSADGYAVARLAIAEPGSGVLFKDDRALPRYERDELSRVLTTA